jgi:hypothetical protein
LDEFAVGARADGSVDGQGKEVDVVDVAVVVVSSRPKDRVRQAAGRHRQAWQAPPTFLPPAAAIYLDPVQRVF